MIGSGIQARHQVRCLSTVRAFKQIVAWSPTAERLRRYCDEMGAEGYDVHAAGSVEEVCRTADMLITATPSRHPLVRAEIFWSRAEGKAKAAPAGRDNSRGGW